MVSVKTTFAVLFCSVFRRLSRMPYQFELSLMRKIQEGWLGLDFTHSSKFNTFRCKQFWILNFNFHFHFSKPKFEFRHVSKRVVCLFIYKKQRDQISRPLTYNSSVFLYCAFGEKDQCMRILAVPGSSNAENWPSSRNWNWDILRTSHFSAFDWEKAGWRCFVSSRFT